MMTQLLSLNLKTESLKPKKEKEQLPQRSPQEYLLDIHPIKRAILFDALKQWPCLIGLVITLLVALILLITLSGKIGILSAIGIILIGLIIEGIIIGIGYRDEQRQARVVTDFLQQQMQFQLEMLKDKKLKANFRTALQHWALTHQIPAESLPDRYQNTDQELFEWLHIIYTLARQVDQALLDVITRHTLKKQPRLRRMYEQKLKQEKNPQVRQQLEQILKQSQLQPEILQTLQDTIRKAHYQLDQSIITLARFSTHLLLLSQKGEETEQLKKLHREIEEEIYQLQMMSARFSDLYQKII